jgi:tetratricopeptide (TPR) repeat protein
MGVVYEARHPQHGRVAVKVLTQAEASARQLQRFATEARACGLLEHPGIVKILETGEARGHPFLTLEFVEGTSLDQLLRSSGVPPAKAAAAIALDLARALAHAHTRGVLHRDVKPANVIRTPQGRVVLADFGLARDPVAERQRLTRTGHMLGTPDYMAPEQAVGDTRAVAATTDVYGLGATLYALLTGRPPFAAASQLELMARIADGQPEPPSSLRAELDPALEGICLRCLAPDPADRYPTAASLAEALETYLRRAQESPAAPRWVGVGLLAALALLALGLGVAAREGEPPGPPPSPSTTAAAPTWDQDLREAQVSLADRRWEDAAQALDRAEGAGADASQVWLLRGDLDLRRYRIERRQTQQTAAVEAFGRAIAHTPKAPAPYALRGLARSYDLLRREDARPDLEQALALGGPQHPLTPVVELRLDQLAAPPLGADPAGHRRAHEAVRAQAERHLAEPRLAGSGHWLRNLRADSLGPVAYASASLGDLPRWEAAVGEIERLASEAPDDPNLPNVLAAVIKNRGEQSGDPELLRAAVPWFDRALEIEPRFTPCFLERGYTQFMVWRLEGGRNRETLARALADVREAQDRDPDSAHNAWVAGLVLREAGEVRAALEAFERATALEPTRASAWLANAQAWLILGEPNRAEETLQRALRAVPEDHPERPQLQELLSRLTGGRR